MACRRLGNEDQAKDVIQDIFVRLWNQREFLQVMHLGSYLRSAVRYEIFNLVAHRKVNDQYFKYLSSLEAPISRSDESLLYNELREKFERLLAGMPQRQREIFRLRFDHEMTTSTIASRLNISQKTVQNQILRAVSYLREGLVTIMLYVLRE